MKAQDIIQQLIETIPGVTGLFSTEKTITSLSKSGSTVTAISNNHGLSTGNYVYIVGASRKTTISSITRSGTVATVTTSQPHDLTELWFDTVSIVGVDQSEYNGDHTLLSVPNRYTFTMAVSGSATTPATSVSSGAMYLLEPWRVGFNGWVSITVVDADTFTYQSDDSFSSTAYGNIKLRSLPRISGAATIERAEAIYTAQGQNKLWAFVVLEEVVANKDRFTLGDGIASHTEGSRFRQQLLNRISIYVFYPVTQSLSGRYERDVITDVSTYFYKCLLGRTYPSYFVDNPTATLNVTGHRSFLYNNAYYIHQFRFEVMTELTKNDVVNPPITRAFRDLNMDFLNDHDVITSQIDINLDDEPI